MQKVLFHADILSQLRDSIKGRRNADILLVISDHIASKDNLKKRMKLILGNGTITVVKKTGIVSLKEIEQAFVSFRSDNIKIVIALGGGSVIDLAKFLMQLIYVQHNEKPYFVTVPTTAGSGSEATSFAVCFHETEKHAVENPLLLPDLVIFDKRFLTTLSSEQIAISGIDALAHAIESFWSVNATAVSRSLATRAIQALLVHLPRAVQGRQYFSSLVIVSEAAYLAGKAINLTGTTGAHALSSCLTGEFGIPHGQAVALFLPAFFHYNNRATNANCNHPDGLDAVQRAMGGLNKLLGVTDCKDSGILIKNLIENIGLDSRFTGTQQEKGMLEWSVMSVNRKCFNSNPVLLDEEMLMDSCKQHLL